MAYRAHLRVRQWDDGALSLSFDASFLSLSSESRTYDYVQYIRQLSTAWGWGPTLQLYGTCSPSYGSQSYGQSYGCHTVAWLAILVLYCIWQMILVQLLVVCASVPACIDHAHNTYTTHTQHIINNPDNNTSGAHSPTDASLGEPDKPNQPPRFHGTVSLFDVARLADDGITIQKILGTHTVHII